MMEWFGLSLTIRSSSRIETEWTPNAAELHGKSLEREIMQQEECCCRIERERAPDHYHVSAREPDANRWSETIFGRVEIKCDLS